MPPQVRLRPECRMQTGFREGERRIQKPGITYPDTAAMLGQLLLVNCDNNFALQPGPALHFASSRSTARRFFMIARAALICSSNSGLFTVRRKPSGVSM